MLRLSGGFAESFRKGIGYIFSKRLYSPLVGKGKPAGGLYFVRKDVGLKCFSVR